MLEAIRLPRGGELGREKGRVDFHLPPSLQELLYLNLARCYPSFPLQPSSAKPSFRPECLRNLRSEIGFSRSFTTLGGGRARRRRDTTSLWIHSEFARPLLLLPPSSNSTLTSTSSSLLDSFGLPLPRRFERLNCLLHYHAKRRQRSVVSFSCLLVLRPLSEHQSTYNLNSLPIPFSPSIQSSSSTRSIDRLRSFSVGRRRRRWQRRRLDRSVDGG